MQLLVQISKSQQSSTCPVFNYVLEHVSDVTLPKKIELSL